MADALLPAGSPGVPVEGVPKGVHSDGESDTGKWLAAVGFTGAAGELALLPNGNGGIARVFFGVGADDNPLLPGKLPTVLPSGDYRLQARPGLDP